MMTILIILMMLLMLCDDDGDSDGATAIVNAAGPGSGANLQVDNFREQANAILKDSNVSSNDNLFFFPVSKAVIFFVLYFCLFLFSLFFSRFFCAVLFCFLCFFFFLRFPFLVVDGSFFVISFVLFYVVFLPLVYFQFVLGFVFLSAVGVVLFCCFSCMFCYLQHFT